MPRMVLDLEPLSNHRGDPRASPQIGAISGHRGASQHDLDQLVSLRLGELGAGPGCGLAAKDSTPPAFQAAFQCLTLERSTPSCSATHAQRLPCLEILCSATTTSFQLRRTACWSHAYSYDASDTEGSFTAQGSIVEDGNNVIANKFHNDGYEYVDLKSFSKWSISVSHLSNMLAPMAKSWQEILEHSMKNNLAVGAIRLHGIVQSISDNLKSGRMSRVEDLVASDTFANLLEQAEHLLEANYFLASGVLCRAVLEERLRMLCDRESCSPAKTRPTINDYPQSLYGKQTITKITLKAIESMAATAMMLLTTRLILLLEMSNNSTRISGLPATL